MVEQLRSLLLLCAALALTTGCSNKHDSKIALLDPSVPQYGKTYAQWAEAWNQYWQSFTPPDCSSPIDDPTGAICQRYQDPESPVFFLTGTNGGPVVRTDCQVPAGKALFFPLVEANNDNSGLPASQQFTDDTLKSYTQTEFDGMEANSLELSVDGERVAGLDAGVVPPTRCMTHFDAASNRYQCDAQAAPTQGDFPGYLAGYWALLAPLPAGEHTIHFVAHAAGMPGQQGFAIEVTYSPLTIAAIE